MSRSRPVLRLFRPAPTRTAILAIVLSSNSQPISAAEPPEAVSSPTSSQPALAAAPVPDALAVDLARLRVAPGLRVEAWAQEPLVQDVTSFTFDASGRAYVVESGRRRTSVFDIRNLQPWLAEDYALRSVSDREAFLRRHLTPGTADYPRFLQALAKSKFRDFNGDGVTDWQDLTVEQERIRVVWDADADGRADHGITLADGFQGLSSGVAAGVLTRGPNLWFTCIPDLWRLPAPQSGLDLSTLPSLRADSPPAERLLSGFGVHVAFGGHDLHGLILGPDGRLYFSIADRGTCVTNREGQVLSVPDSGAVFRCEPDGARLEVVATGLRNPQELAFDDLGDLWTGDNNGDGGDKARWTRVLEGSNYGWTLGWQWLPTMGAWNAERLWHTRDSNSAAYLLPPVAHIGHGPAGIAHYPGTGLSDRFQGHFMMADFPGGVRAFRVEPDGAFHRVVEAGPWMEDNSPTHLTGKVLWNLAPVDLAFPPDGGLVVADAFPSWEKTGRARLWKVTDPAADRDPAVREVARLLREGFAQQPTGELLSLLDHRDQRIRLEAQWTLAEAGPSSLPGLVEKATHDGPVRGRVHALWAIAHLARRSPFPASEAEPTANRLHRLLESREAPLREAVLPTLAAVRPSDLMAPVLMAYALDPNPRVAAAALRAGSSLLIGLRPEITVADDVILPPLTQGHPDDPVVREARITALVRLDIHAGGPGHRWAVTLERSPDPRVRLLALLSRRRRQDPAVARHLSDPHPTLVLEAARAIHDLPILEALPQLARLAADPSLLDPVLGGTWPANLTFSPEECRTWILRRAANAAFRLGTPEQAVHLARLATRTSAPERVRVEALESLAEWPKPPGRDRVTGLHRPLAARDPRPAEAALAGVWSQWGQDGVPEPILLAALRAGAVLRPPGFEATVGNLTRHPAPAVRAEAQRLAALARPPSITDLTASLEDAPLAARRTALSLLADSGDPRAAEVLARWVNRVVDGMAPPELHLDILEAARRNPSPAVVPALRAWTNSLPAGNPLASYLPVLHGGDPGHGGKLFAERADWGCQRCHKLGGVGGEVGPELTGIGRTRGREYVLTSILHPNQDIAPGYENVVLTRVDGGTVAGTLKSETATDLVVDTGEDGLQTVPRAKVRSRQRGLSAMVEGLADLMTLEELRDVLAALSQ